MAGNSNVADMHLCYALLDFCYVIRTQMPLNYTDYTVSLINDLPSS